MPPDESVAPLLPRLPRHREICLSPLTRAKSYTSVLLVPVIFLSLASFAFSLTRHILLSCRLAPLVLHLFAALRPPPPLLIRLRLRRFAYYLGDAASVCSPETKSNDVQCTVMDTSGNVVMHHTFANSPPSAAVFIGDIEPGLFKAMDTLGYFKVTQCNDVQEGAVKNFVTNEIKKPYKEIYGGPTWSNPAGETRTYEVAAVPGTNIYLIISKLVSSSNSPLSPADACKCSVGSSKCPCVRAQTFETCSDEKSSISTQKNAACPAHVQLTFSATQAPPLGMKKCMSIDCDNREYAQCIGTIGCKFCVITDVGAKEIGEPYCMKRAGRQCTMTKGGSSSGITPGGARTSSVSGGNARVAGVGVAGVVVGVAVAAVLQW